MLYYVELCWLAVRGAEIISKDENMQRARGGPSRPSPRFHAGHPTFSGAGDYLPKYIRGCLHKTSQCTPDPFVDEKDRLYLGDLVDQLLFVVLHLHNHHVYHLLEHLDVDALHVQGSVIISTEGEG